MRHDLYGLSRDSVVWERALLLDYPAHLKADGMGGFVKAFAKSKSVYFVLMIFLVTILTGCTNIKTLSTNATTAGMG